MEHVCQLEVRSYECDAYGHVNNAVYLNYLEVARHEYLKALVISIEELRAAGTGLWVARISIDFRSPALPGDRLAIHTKPLKRTRIGGILGQRIVRGEALVAEAQVTWVSVNARGRPTPLPPGFEREGLAP
jgi:YbgC/YbaW family acyl-CoA thioester hydrolase